MAGYFPMDRGLLNSTLWITGDSDTRSLWVFLLLSADIKTGIVTHSIPAIANANPGISVEKVRSILDVFCSPDYNSRSPENEGRRIEYVDPDNPNGGIRVLNYLKKKEELFGRSTARNARYDDRYESETGQKRKHRATRGDKGRRGATKEKEKEKEKELKNLPDSPESVSSQIQELEHRYSLELELIHETRNSCALSRKNGTMTDSVWLRVLQKLDKHPIESVLSACVTFCEKHADGEKDERYLLGIVKGETKKRGVTRSGRRVEKPQEVLDAERILRTATQSMLDNGERERCEAIIDTYNKRKDQ